jgi:hypothetical protein
MKQTALKKLLVCLIAILVFTNCSKQQLSAETIVKNSIEKHGGAKAWNSLKRLSFDKNVALFLEDGTIESSIKKHQEFTFYPNLEGKITWNTNDKKNSILYHNSAVLKFVNDSLITNPKDLQIAKNNFNAALYVISQPFNFLNENTILTSLGI